METPTVDADIAALEQMAAEADRSEGRPIAEGTQKPETPVLPAEGPPKRPEESGKPQPTPEKPPDSSELEPEELPPAAREDQRDEKGRFKAKEPAEVDQNGEKPLAPVAEKKSRYAEAREREAKETARQDRSWSALQREKDQFRAQQDQWEKQRRMEELQAQSQVRPPEKDGIDIQGYHRAYQDFRKSGDYENAVRSLETVLELEARGRQEQERQQYAQYELAWRTDMEKAIAENQDLQDPDSALYQEVDRIVKQEPYLFYIPGGFNKAMEIAYLLLDAGARSELRDENEQLRAWKEQHERSSQPARGGPGKPPSPTRSSDDMTLAELEALAEQEDALNRR